MDHFIHLKFYLLNLFASFLITLIMFTTQWQSHPLKGAQQKHHIFSLRVVHFSQILICLFGILTSSHIIGCDPIWNYLNQPTLEREIVELFRTHGVALHNLHCHMIGTSRSAICELNLTPEQVALVVKGLNLKELEPSSEENSWIEIPESKRGCLMSNFFQGAKQVKVYLSDGRPPELRLKNGSAFEYFILFQDLDTHNVCIQVSYAYG